MKKKVGEVVLETILLAIAFQAWSYFIDDVPFSELIQLGGFNGIILALVFGAMTEGFFIICEIVVEKVIESRKKKSSH